MSEKTLNLIKGKHRFTIAYASGDESVVLDQLRSMVHDKSAPFDWFDAALMAGQVCNDLARQIIAESRLPAAIAVQGQADGGAGDEGKGR